VKESTGALTDWFGRNWWTVD